MSKNTSLSLTLAGTPLAKDIASLNNSSSVSPDDETLVRQGEQPIPSHSKPVGYVFSCPHRTMNKDCKLLHAIRDTPGPEAYSVQIMDHIRIDRKNTHLDGTPLTPQEQAAVNTQLDPYGQFWVRSGSQKSLFLPAGLFPGQQGDWGYALVYYPNAVWHGQRGNWDIVSLHPGKEYAPTEDRRT